MTRGLSKQQMQILELLKKRGVERQKLPFMRTREIVMALHPEVQAYLDEEKRFRRIQRYNMLSPHFPEMVLDHRKWLKSLPNYHTARTSVNRALRNLVKRGLVARQEWGVCFNTREMRLAGF